MLQKHIKTRKSMLYHLVEKVESYRNSISLIDKYLENAESCNHMRYSVKEIRKIIDIILVFYPSSYNTEETIVKKINSAMVNPNTLTIINGTLWAVDHGNWRKVLTKNEKYNGGFPITEYPSIIDYKLAKKHEPYYTVVYDNCKYVFGIDDETRPVRLYQ